MKNAQNAGAIARRRSRTTRDRRVRHGRRLIAADHDPVAHASRLANGNAIKGELGYNTVNVTLKQNPPAGSENSLRWLMGEDSTAFGGAIRDMWTPTCMGDPGKVTDAQYHCLTTDGGGVHSNSGVPNHGYALLVDGGTYNGQTVTRTRPHQGRPHLLAGAERLPGSDEQVRGPRRCPRGILHGSDRPTAQRSQHKRSGRSVRPDDQRGGLRRGDRHDRGGRASYRPDAVQLPADR